MAFVVGSWKGTGVDSQGAIRGELTVCYRMGFLVFTERLYDAQDASLVHEDESWVGYANGQEQLVATCFSPPAHVSQRLVLCEEGAFRWWGGPTLPLLYFQSKDEHLQITLVSPEGTPMSTMMYTPCR